MTDRHRTGPEQAPGSLTTLMRAAAPRETRKALRVGLVHRGKVIDERVVKPGEHVSVGPNERATFVVQGGAIPPGFRLFESTAEGFVLHVAPRMSGRVAAAGGTTDIAPESDASRAVPLSPDARGKVILGEHSFLFQLMIPAPPLGKAQLPAGVKKGFADIDWRTSIVAAFSFLFHFGAVGSIYSDWMDPVVDEEVDTAQILEQVKNLPPPPAVERPKEDAATAPTSPAPIATAKSSGQSSGRAATGGPGGGAGRGDAAAHQLSNQLAALELQVLTGLNSSAGGATNAVLGGGDLPLGMLDRAAASSSGVRSGSLAGLDLGGSTGPLRPGSIARGPVQGDTQMGPVTAGTAVNVRPPSGSVASSPPLVTGGDIPNAGATVAGMVAGFRRCYNLGLSREDPTMKGTVRFTIKVGPNGEVLSAGASGGGTLSATVIGCMRNRIASAQFNAPPSGGGTLVLPVTLTAQ